MKLTIKELQDIETDMLKEVVSICKKHNIKYFLAYGSVLGAVRHQGPIPWDNDLDIAIPYPELNRFLKYLRLELPDKYYVDFHDDNKNYIKFFPRIGLKGYSTKLLHMDVYLLTGAPNSKIEQEYFKKEADRLKLLIQYKNLKEGYFSFNKISLKAKIAIYLKTIQLLFVSREKFLEKGENLLNKYPYKSSKYIVNVFGGYKMKEFIPKDIINNGSILKYDNLEVNGPENPEEYLKHFYGDYMQYPSKEEQEKVNNVYYIN